MKPQHQTLLFMFCLILILIHFQVEMILYQVKSLKQKIVNLERHCFIPCLIVNFFTVINIMPIPSAVTSVNGEQINFLESHVILYVF